MKKWKIRREFLKLRIKYRSYAKIQAKLRNNYNYNVSRKTLKRWWNKFINDKEWDLRDNSTRPHKIHYKFSKEDKQQAIKLRKLTGWDSIKIRNSLEKKSIFMSKSYIEQIIKRSMLSRGSKIEGKRLKWVRWEREHPNSLWQLDGSGDENKGWILPVIDDCSRYCLGITTMESMSTKNVINFLEELFKMHGKPREVLTDNGPEYRNNFDKWCKKHNIKHIRSAVHKPTTCGKVERFHQTIDKELSYCNNNLEYFRYRYNHYRPHLSLNLLTPADVYFAFHKLF